MSSQPTPKTMKGTMKQMELISNPHNDVRAKPTRKARTTTTTTESAKSVRLRTFEPSPKRVKAKAR